MEDSLSELAPPQSKKKVKSSPMQRPSPTPAAKARPQPAQAASVSVSESDGRDPQARSMLSDLLDEFKEGIEESESDQDDPETHYNLGVAFREMGLLDEAIGELQK